MGLGVRQLHDHLALPLLPLVQEVGLRGIPFDARRRDAMVREVEARIGRLDLELFGAGINAPSSAQKLGRDLLALGVPLQKLTKGGGQYVTDLDVLRRIQFHYNEADGRTRFPFLPALIERKKLEKARANLESMRPCRDGRLRTALRSTGTETGRYSSAGLRWCPVCKEPNHGTNLQNIAKNAEEIGVNVRDCFSAEPGWEFVELDYSMLELRIMAYIAGVRKLIERLESGADIHRLHTEALFDGRYTDSLRTLAKNFFYALQYGGSEQAVQIALAKKGEYLEQSFILKLMQRIYQEYPEMPLWQGQTGAQLTALRAAKQPVLIRNAFGRCRVLLGSDPLKEALSTQIQGTAADIMSFVLLRLHSSLRDNLVAQIHDSFLGYVPERWAQGWPEGMQKQMERPVWLSSRFVSMPVDVKRGRVWSQMEKA